MKKLLPYYAFLLLTLVAMLPAGAQQSDSLSMLVRRLQSSPGDTILRARIIRLGRSMYPAPALPEDVERYLTRGKTAARVVKSGGDYTAAIAELNGACLAGPWLPEPYYDLALVHELSNHYREAIANYRFYLMAAPMADDAAAVRSKIYALEYKAEQSAAKSAPTNSQAIKDEINRKKAEEATLDENEKKIQAGTAAKKKKLEAKENRVARERAEADDIKAKRVIKSYTYLSFGASLPVGHFAKQPVNPPNNIYIEVLEQAALTGQTGTGAKVFMDMNIGHVFYINRMHVWGDRFKMGFDWDIMDANFIHFDWASLGDIYNPANFKGSLATKYGTIINGSSEFGPIFTVCPAPKLFIDLYYRVSLTIPFVFSSPLTIYQYNTNNYSVLDANGWLALDIRHSLGVSLRYSLLRINFNANMGKLQRNWSYYYYTSGSVNNRTDFTSTVFAPFLQFTIGFAIPTLPGLYMK